MEPIYPIPPASKLKRIAKSCLELMAAVINPKMHFGPGGRKRKKPEEVLPELGKEWADLAAGILDIDEEVVRKEIL